MLRVCSFICMQLCIFKIQTMQLTLAGKKLPQELVPTIVANVYEDRKNGTVSEIRAISNFSQTCKAAYQLVQNNNFFLQENLSITKELFNCVITADEKESTIMLYILHSAFDENYDWWLNDKNCSLVLYCTKNKSGRIVKELIKKSRNQPSDTVIEYVCKKLITEKDTVAWFFGDKVSVEYYATTEKATIAHLIFLCSSLTLDIVKSLLVSGADLNSQNSKLETPFHVICKNTNVTLQMLQCCFGHKACIDTYDSYKKKPYHYICENTAVTFEIVKLFIENGADVTKVDNHGCTPLMYLAKNKNISYKMIHYLVKQGVVFDEDTLIALCKNQCITLTILKLFDLNFFSTDNLTSLYYFYEQNHYEDIKTYLLENYSENLNLEVDIDKCLIS